MKLALQIMNKKAVHKWLSQVQLKKERDTLIGGLCNALRPFLLRQLQVQGGHCVHLKENGDGPAEIRQVELGKTGYTLNFFHFNCSLSLSLSLSLLQ